MSATALELSRYQNYSGLSTVLGEIRVLCSLLDLLRFLTYTLVFVERIPQVLHLPGKERGMI